MEGAVSTFDGNITVDSFINENGGLLNFGSSIFVISSATQFTNAVGGIIQFDATTGSSDGRFATD